MLTINTNLSSLIVQTNLKQSTNALNKAIERMTTGFKINGAKDNAANYGISTKMSSQISSYEIAEENAMMGLDIIETASSNLDIIENRLSRLRALQEQALNGTYGEESLKAINAEVNSLVDEINRLYTTTEYNGINLFLQSAPQAPDVPDVPQYIEMTANGNTTFKQLGITETEFTVGTNIDHCVTMMNVDLDDTLDSFFETLRQHDIHASITNGVISLESSSGMLIRGALADALGISQKGWSSTISTSQTAAARGLMVAQEGGEVTLPPEFTIKGQAKQRASLVNSDKSSGSSYADQPIFAEDISKIGLGLKGTYTVTVNGSETTIDMKISDTIVNLQSKLEKVGYTFANDANGNIIMSCDGVGGIDPLSELAKVLVLDEPKYIGAFCAKNTDSSKQTYQYELPALEYKPVYAPGSFSLQVGINSGESSQITVETSFTLAGTELLRGIGIDNNDYLAILDKMLSDVSLKQTELGAAQNRVTSALEEINTHYENLVSSRSTLRDADVAEESSEYIRNQILQQASATLLATANQMPALALQLL